MKMTSTQTPLSDEGEIKGGIDSMPSGVLLHDVLQFRLKYANIELLAPFFDKYLECVKSAVDGGFVPGRLGGRRERREPAQSVGAILKDPHGTKKLHLSMLGCR